MSSSAHATQVDQPNKNPKKNAADDARRAFHVHQISNSGIDLSAFDPDPPVELGTLQRFDGPIQSLLEAKGYNQADKPSGGPPKSVRVRNMAQKIGCNNCLSEDEIETIARRIGWLQRNEFRWDARNGYEALFASKPCRSKAAKGPGKGAETKAQAAAREPVAPGVPDLLPAPTDRTGRHFVAPVGPSDVGTLFESEPPISQPPARADDDIGGLADEPYSGQSSRFLSWPGNPSHWAEWSDRINKAIPKDAPITPPKPKTYAKEFPVEKAKSFLLSIVTDKPIDRQVQTGKLLRDDREQLHQALTHDDRARDDILDAFAHLGIDLEP